MSMVSSWTFFDSYPWVCVLILLVNMQYFRTSVPMIFSYWPLILFHLIKFLMLIQTNFRCLHLIHIHIFTLDIGNILEHLWVIWCSAENASTPKSLPAVNMFIGVFFVLPNSLKWKNIWWVLVLFLLVGFLQWYTISVANNILSLVKVVVCYSTQNSVSGQCLLK